MKTLASRGLFQNSLCRQVFKWLCRCLRRLLNDTHARWSRCRRKLGRVPDATVLKFEGPSSDTFHNFHCRTKSLISLLHLSWLPDAHPAADLECRYFGSSPSVCVALAALLSPLHSAPHTLQLLKWVLQELRWRKANDVKPVAWLATMQQNRRRQSCRCVRRTAIHTQVIQNGRVNWSLLQGSTLYERLEGTIKSFYLSIRLWIIHRNQVMGDTSLRQEALEFFRRKLRSIVGHNAVGVSFPRKDETQETGHRACRDVGAKMDLRPL